MTEMIERVARAISIAEGYEPEDWRNERLRTRFLSAAEAAIKALREPTTAQLGAAQTAWLNDPLRKSSTIYHAMIDAALAEPSHD